MNTPQAVRGHRISRSKVIKSIVWIQFEQWFFVECQLENTNSSHECHFLEVGVSEKNSKQYTY